MSDVQLRLPLLAVRDVVVYPHTQIALFVGRPQSVNAVKVAENWYDGEIVLVSQKDSLSEEISPDNLHTHGTLCKVISTMPHDSDDECLKVLLEGRSRVAVNGVIEDAEQNVLFGNYDQAPLVGSFDGDDLERRRQVLIEMFDHYAELNLRNNREIVNVASKTEDLVQLAYFIATRINLDLDKKLDLLTIDELSELYNALVNYFVDEKAEQDIENELQEAVRKQMENNHREYYLNEKMKVIKNELSDLNDAHDDDDSELEERLAQADLPEDVRKKAQSEFKKLKMMPASSSEASVVRGYIEWILDTPWNKASKVTINLDKAKETLDKDHYGLDDVKDRILEYLAVQSRVKNVKGSILCLVGPPGVGKTSLGESIARATGRKFVRMALGGVRDEAEIRGHRRTYIGAMPGKIVQSLAKVEVKNPLFLLDEIDKMAQDYRGDPASALLEVLDPSQNKAFNDHYLDLDLDLSQVMFICTANSMNIPPALLDRMEVIRLPGYTEDEKLAIAKNYLTPKALEQNGLKDSELSITDDAITSIVRHYTREAGVRNLEREINKISRKAVRNHVETHGTKPKKNTPTETIVIDDSNISDYLGVKPYDYGVHASGLRHQRWTGHLLVLGGTGTRRRSCRGGYEPGPDRLLQAVQLGGPLHRRIPGGHHPVRRLPRHPLDLAGTGPVLQQDLVRTGRHRRRADHL